jgi:hypothetical protein
MAMPPQPFERFFSNPDRAAVMRKLQPEIDAAVNVAIEAFQEQADLMKRAREAGQPIYGATPAQVAAAVFRESLS